MKNKKCSINIDDIMRVSKYTESIHATVQRLLNDKEFLELICDYMEYGYSTKVLNKLVDIIYVGIDSEHSNRHIEDVTTRGLNMIESLNLNLNKEEVTLFLLAALFHDAGMAIDREDHDVIGAALFDELGIIPLESSKIVQNAILCHRASSKQDADHTIGLVLSAADRGSPESLDNIIQRVYNYASQKNKDKTFNEHCLDTLVFILNKYSRAGYARNNSIYKLYYKEHIETQYKNIDRLNLDYISRVTMSKLTSSQDD